MSIIKNKLKSNYSQIPNQLLLDNRLSNGSKVLICYLLSLPDDWEINNNHIMKQLNIGQPQTIAKYWKELIDTGWIFRERKHNDNGTFDNYQYTLHSDLNVDNNILPDGGLPHMVNTTYGEMPILNNTKKETNNNINNITYDNFDEKEQDKIQEFIQFRKDIKKPLTSNSLSLCTNKLIKFKDKGINIIDVINNSIESGWTGLFEPKVSQFNNNNYNQELIPEDSYPYKDLLFINTNDHYNGHLCGIMDGQLMGVYKKHVHFILLTMEETMKVCKDNNIDYNALQRIDYGVWMSEYSNDIEMIPRCITGYLNAI